MPLQLVIITVSSLLESTKETSKDNSTAMTGSRAGTVTVTLAMIKVSFATQVLIAFCV